MINGPHCPKCGWSNYWAYYFGADPENPDALRCETKMDAYDSEQPVVCGYIYWRRNAPASEPTSKEATAAARAKYEADQAAMEREVAIADRRARVRALVHSLLNSPEILKAWGTGASVVSVAVSLDDEIEALTNIQGRDS